MKIVYVTPGCFDKGGISRYNRYQIKVLRETEGEGNVRVLSLLGPDQHSFEGEYPVYWHGNGIGMGSKLRMVIKLIYLSIFWRPDAIWIGHVNLSGLCYFASKFCGAKTILNAYGLEIWSAMRRDAAWGLRKVEHIVSDCHNTAQYLIKNNIRRPEHITVIWDCIDTDRFKPSERVSSEVLKKYNIPDPNNHFIILSLGRLAKPDALYKGYDRLLKVVAGLVNDYKQVRLVFAGRGNYREDLEVLAKEMNLDQYVSFTGSVDEEDLVAVYQSCHVFSLITIAGEGKGEGIPLTPLEAMACGKPVLVGNQDGSREAVFENSNGFVLDPMDLESHRKVFKAYLDEPGLLKQHSTKAFEIGHKIFSYDRFCLETQNVMNNKLRTIGN